MRVGSCRCLAGFLRALGTTPDIEVSRFLFYRASKIERSQYAKNVAENMSERYKGGPKRFAQPVSPLSVIFLAIPVYSKPLRSCHTAHRHHLESFRKTLD